MNEKLREALATIKEHCANCSDEDCTSARCELVFYCDYEFGRNSPCRWTIPEEEQHNEK